MLEKTFNPKTIEERLYKAWEEAGAFSCDPLSGKPPFTVMMPPPNVTGSLHMGHALNATLHDIQVRYRRMKGYDVLWLPGTDHASIAVHMVLEKQMEKEGTDRFKLGREAFMKRAWEWKKFSGNTITRQLRRLGATPDWTRERFTLDAGLSDAVTKAFVALYEKKLIYRAERLVNWDPERKTVISDLEVEQKEKKGHMWYVRYALESETAEHIVIATTRPETMLGDAAIAVHPDDERYKHLIGKSVNLPVANRLIPVIADSYVDPEHGSGALKITPAHDFNDFEVGRRHNLPVTSIFDESARILPLESIPYAYHGLDRFEARKKILAELEDLDALEKEEAITHTVPYGDRSGVIIEPFLTKQWFCDAPALAGPAARAVREGGTEFIPAQWANTYFSWVDNMLPWCISRQLWWGHRIPAWHGPDGAVFVAEDEEAASAQARSHYGRDEELARDEDVLDTWFSAALWPFSTLGWPEKTPELARYYPGDVLITGFDIIFFWVARMMMMGLEFMDEAPFRKVYIHALVRDASGQKMSKSKGNVMDPLELIDTFGADALRFTLSAMAAQGRDIRLSEERLQGYRNFATKLWNAARYCEMNGCVPDSGFNPTGIRYVPNRWIVSALAQTKTALEGAIEAYKYNEAAAILYQFVWGTFCDWYLEFTKPVLQGESDLKDEIRATTAWALEQIVMLLNPFMPFITEELYAGMAARGRKEWLINGAWPEFPAALNDQQAESEMGWLMRLIGEIRSVRVDMNVPANAQIDLVVQNADEQTCVRLQSYGEIIGRMARVQGIGFGKDTQAGAIRFVLEEATYLLPVADYIDLEKEKTRLSKEVEKLEQNIRKDAQKLDNAEFTANAPEEIIEETRARMEAAAKTRDKLMQALQGFEK